MSPQPQRLSDAPDCLLGQPPAPTPSRHAAEVPHDEVAVALRIANAIRFAVYDVPVRG